MLSLNRLIACRWLRGFVVTSRERTVDIDGLDVFYREAGDPSAPTLVLLHGFPTSSIAHQERIGELQDEVHPIAPDYPGFGPSSAPAAFSYVPLEPRLTQTAALTRAFPHSLSNLSPCPTPTLPPHQTPTQGLAPTGARAPTS